MSNPNDPFGRSDRTIIRPNPAGRRVAPPPSNTPAPHYAPPQQASPGVPGAGDEWARMPAPPPPQHQQPHEGQPRTPVLKREQLATPNQNAFVRASAPMLLLLGRMRVSLMRASPAQLMDQVADSIEMFEHEVRGAGYSAEMTRVAKYIVCSTADDIVQNIPAEDRHVWTQYSMLSRFFGERIGGVRFFDELTKAKADPSVNYELLELFYACLSLGFQGIHRTTQGGAAHLQMITRDLYETLRRVKRADPDLSPRWMGQSIPVQVAKFRVPVWAVASVAAALLLGGYLILRALLGGNGEAAAAAIIAVHPTSEVGIQRQVYKPPPPPPPAPIMQAQAKVCATVQPPIQCVVTPNTITVRLLDITLFDPGKAEVTAQYRPLIDRMASVLETEGGAIRVIGHTDSTPIRTARFPSNYELSLARAKAVADLLRAGLSEKTRISNVEGKGADVPFDTNATPAGRAKNRRVEIIIQRTS